MKANWALSSMKRTLPLYGPVSCGQKISQCVSTSKYIFACCSRICHTTAASVVFWASLLSCYVTVSDSIVQKRYMSIHRSFVSWQLFNSNSDRYAAPRQLIIEHE
jgi:hypothetical protein